MVAVPRFRLCGDEAARDCAGDEQHCDEQQAGAEEHRREEPVFGGANAVADHSHEPQEREPGEGHEIECEDHGAFAPWVVEPRGSVVWVCGDSDPQQDEGGAEEQSEHDAGDCGSARRAQ